MPLSCLMRRSTRPLLFRGICQVRLLSVPVSMRSGMNGGRGFYYKKRACIAFWIRTTKESFKSSSTNTIYGSSFARSVRYSIMDMMTTIYDFRNGHRWQFLGMCSCHAILLQPHVLSSLKHWESNLVLWVCINMMMCIVGTAPMKFLSMVAGFLWILQKRLLCKTKGGIFYHCAM